MKDNETSAVLGERIFICNVRHHFCFFAVKPPATTAPPPGNCANPKWIPNGDYCYSVSVNQGRSWPEANFQCQKSGMQLVSVHSEADMNFLLNLVSQAKVNNPQYKPNIWVGLAKGPMGMCSIPFISLQQEA